jgi:hypothetical protein
MAAASDESVAAAPRALGAEPASTERKLGKGVLIAADSPIVLPMVQEKAKQEADLRVLSLRPSIIVHTARSDFKELSEEEAKQGRVDAAAEQILLTTVDFLVKSSSGFSAIAEQWSGLAAERVLQYYAGRNVAGE